MQIEYPEFAHSVICSARMRVELTYLPIDSLILNRFVCIIDLSSMIHSFGMSMIWWVDISLMLAEFYLPVMKITVSIPTQVDEFENIFV